MTSICMCVLRTQQNESIYILIYRVSIKSYPDYKHLLQENYVEYKHFFYHYLSQFLNFYSMCLLFVYVCIPRSFLVINVCSQGKTLCSPCISNKMQRYTVYFIWKLLYMFRVVTLPIIRKAKNCIYSIWYLSDHYCYLPLQRQVAETV